MTLAQLAVATTLGTSSFFGGSQHDQVTDIAVDRGGNVYVTGWTMSPDFPVRDPLFGFTGGADDSECDSFAGCPDAFIAKLTPGARSVAYATYLAGSRYDEGTSIAIDAAGSAYVVGKTDSLDFPTGGDPQPYATSRAFLTKLAPDGSRLEWTRYVGGTDDLTPADVALDGRDNVFVAGTTWNEFFGTTEGAYDRDCIDPRYYSTCVDAYIAKFTTSGTHVATTMFGGHHSMEHARAIGIDSAGRPVIAGSVAGPNDGFPRTPGTYGTTPLGTSDAAFIARLSADLSRLEWAAAFGGTDRDDVQDMTLDAQDRPVIVGLTHSRDFPTTTGALDRQCNHSDDFYSCPESSDGFAAKLAADGTGVVWGTYLGGSSDDMAYSIAGDANGFAVSGTSANEPWFPLRDAYQSTVNGYPDAFVVRLAQDGALQYGTLLGGSGMDDAPGVALDPQGNAWLGGGTYSADFPVTAGAIQTTGAGGECIPITWQQFPNCADGFVAQFGSPVPLTTSSQPPPPAVAPSRSGTAVPRATTRRLTVRRNGRRLRGRLHGNAACVARARLVVERRVRGRWRPVRRVRTSADGRFTLRLPTARGRYRVRAPGIMRGALMCRAARSH
jgi:hypothetical protein